MKRITLLLLDVWREVCRHLEIGESVSRVAPLLVRYVPVDLVLIRQLDLKRSWVDTCAAGRSQPNGNPMPARTVCSAEQLERLLAWCQLGEVVHGRAEAIRTRLPGLVPDEITADVLASPLAISDAPAGLLVFTALRGQRFGDEGIDLFRSLREPFTVALENDRRLRELTTLREAVEADNRALLSKLGRQDISDSIVGAETGLRPVMEQIDLVARSDAPVLVLGETGSGKEVVARAIHKRSRRSSGPFLRVNCGAIPPELIDSELFGHERGSFTGAVGQRKGWFERADGGTLFLDECGELPPPVQVRLLRILQDGSFERVGGERSLHVDVRIVAATHRDLHALVSSGRFREDLWYRIAVFPIHLPPLRARREDISALAAHFALRAAQRLGTAPLLPSADDLNLLFAYPWPGNVRELAAVMERAAILGDGKCLEIARALGATTPQPPRPAESREAVLLSATECCLTLDEAITRHIESALLRTRGRIEGPDGAARLLSINPHTLRAKMRKLGLAWQKFRSPRQ
ncbi:MAG TPA: sigma 54-interacting transcriptional regulator [Gemmataceae bacterium]|jgi:transcriptional regulator with GAF, ATPase, and Fis domain